MICERCPLANDWRPCPGEADPAICEADLADRDQAIMTCLVTMPQDFERPPGFAAKSIFQKIVSFTVAATQHVAAGMPMASDEQKNARLAICRACDQFDSERAGCKLCGCNMDIKAGWAGQACPVGKWAATSPESSEETR